uniref:Chromo domain-containing protein n=1 Tax=Bionectria ochroleuca TaxID=29856 RepID=A0A8H7NHP0_BIOOC
MRPRDDITRPFSGHGEDDLEAPEHRPAADEVRVDADDDDHGCIGEPTTMVSTSTEQSQPTAIVTDVDAEWEIDGDLMGKEVIDGEVYYLVPWKPTLVPP